MVAPVSSPPHGLATYDDTPASRLVERGRSATDERDDTVSTYQTMGIIPPYLQNDPASGQIDALIRSERANQGQTTSATPAPLPEGVQEQSALISTDTNGQSTVEQLLARANAHLGRGEWLAAESAAQEACQVSPNHFEALYALAEAQSEQGKRQVAKATLSDAFAAGRARGMTLSDFCDVVEAKGTHFETLREHKDLLDLLSDQDI